MKPDPAGATSSTISLREYLEAKIEGEREMNRNFREAQAAEFSIFKETSSKEIAEARQNVKEKMETLNELRRAVEQDRAQFVRIEKFDADMKARDAKVDAVATAAYAKTDGVERLLATRLDILEKWQARMMGSGIESAGGEITGLQKAGAGSTGRGEGSKQTLLYIVMAITLLSTILGILAVFGK